MTNCPRKCFANRNPALCHALHLHVFARCSCFRAWSVFFVPLAEAVVFAMLASYFLSRTIVPTMAKYYCGREARRGNAPPAIRWYAFKSVLRQRSRDSPQLSWLLEISLHHWRGFPDAFFVSCLGSLAILIPWLGGLFPQRRQRHFQTSICVLPRHAN